MRRMQRREFPRTVRIQALFHDGGEGLPEGPVAAAGFRNENSAVGEIFPEFRQFPFRRLESSVPGDENHAGASGISFRRAQFGDLVVEGSSEQFRDMLRPVGDIVFVRIPASVPFPFRDGIGRGVSRNEQKHETTADDVIPPVSVAEDVDASLAVPVHAAHLLEAVQDADPFKGVERVIAVHAPGVEGAQKVPRVPIQPFVCLPHSRIHPVGAAASGDREFQLLSEQPQAGEACGGHGESGSSAHIGPSSVRILSSGVEGQGRLDGFCRNFQTDVLGR